MAEADRPAVFTIPSNRAFADSLAAGLIDRYGGTPLGLAEGRVLLPNNRAVRAITDAFVRLSGGGLLLPRLIPIGDPELDERIGGALDLADAPEPPAIDPTSRLLTLAAILGPTSGSAAEAMRLAADLARTLDSLTVEEVDARRLRDVVADSDPGAQHWEKSLRQLEAILTHWPAIRAADGAIDLSERRNRLLRRLAERWKGEPPPGFTVAAGINTAAPAIAALLARVARMNGGSVVLPGLWLDDTFPTKEWEALGADGEGSDEPAHPQYHLKLLLGRMGINRAEVQLWPDAAGPAAPAHRALAVANAMTAPAASHKWETLKPFERRFDGVRLAEFPDPAAEAQGIALAMREAIETPGRTAALMTPDRALAERVSAHLKRWGITADDSAGLALSRTPTGTLFQALAALAVEDVAPVPLLALLKHPLVGGEGDDRRRWLDIARSIDLALRGPRPPAGMAGIDRALGEGRAASGWSAIRPLLAPVAALLDGEASLASFAQSLADGAQSLSHGRAWTGQAGRAAADLLADLAASPRAATIRIGADDALPILRQLLDTIVVRPSYGGHPRLFIWGLLEGRLQSADLMILGGLNEGSWPALPSPDPFLPPRIRADLGVPTLELRIGLSAQDFAEALGAPEVLVTRAKRDSRSPTVASRLWLRLRAVAPDIAIEEALPALALKLDDPGVVLPADRPEPTPAAHQRPKEISVTAVDRLKADPYSFYAQKILRLSAVDAVDADASAAWKGTSVHKVFELWLKEDNCDPDTLMPRIGAMLSDPAVHPLMRSLWRPRIEAAARWALDEVAKDRAAGREPIAAEVDGGTTIAGVDLHGKADRFDLLPDGRSAIVDFKTGHAPDNAVIDAGFALQLGLLGLIARQGAMGERFTAPSALEYWSLAKDPKRREFGYRRSPGDPAQFLAFALEEFEKVAGDYLTGTKGFRAKLVPEHAVYGDYDQLMRLEEWYARL